ncbi:helix-turn-helix transcriptional regulator [Devosia submarina]|uniref:helix-turn-helix transcriptional regulator n=1 Tax=Devosia submarina TaxID=1173082 RepID=UPI000D377569|nr:helix-turn-helix domain-containing protein [Devosia submarina]
MTDHLPSAAQVRAARALLAWSQEDLAKASGTSRRTLATLEGGGIVSSETMEAVRSALEAGGIVFTGNGGTEGLKRR